MPILPRIVALLTISFIAGCATQSQAASPSTATASSSPEAELCQRAAVHIDALHGEASANEFRDFSAKIATELREFESTVGVDLAITNSYAMLLGIDISSYRDAQQRLDTAMDFVSALETYVTSCDKLGVKMPTGWNPAAQQSGPQALGGRSVRWN